MREREKRREETVWQQVCVFCKHFVKVRTPSLTLIFSFSCALFVILASRFVIETGDQFHLQFGVFYMSLNSLGLRSLVFFREGY